MTRYIAIEHNSGYIWGDAIAETPEAACGMIDHEADRTLPPSSWESAYSITDTDGGYHVYAAPAGFPEIEDGQDRDMIARVTDECAYVGDYVQTDDAESA